MAKRVELLKLEGSEILTVLDDVGALRIRIFREFPYLYEGDLGYEREYLKRYAASPRAALILARDPYTGAYVGASTCLPASDESEAFTAPLKAAGHDLATGFYFGESLLLPEYRGQGTGKSFFDLREFHALGYRANWTAFCAVDRADTHPHRPAGYRPLDPFWRQRGYVKHEGAQATFTWLEVGQTEESTNTLTFWIKTWNR